MSRSRKEGMHGADAHHVITALHHDEAFALLKGFFSLRRGRSHFCCLYRPYASPPLVARQNAHNNFPLLQWTV